MKIKKTNSILVIWCVISFILVIFWMFVVFDFSSAYGDNSSNTSGNTIRFVVRLFNKNIDEVSLEAIVEKYQFLVRKLAHFAIYFIGGILLFNLFYNLKKLIYIDYNEKTYSIFCGFLYSVSDEIHQSFVPGRSGRVLDVIIDTSGVIIGVLFLYMIIILKNKNKNEK